MVIMVTAMYTAVLLVAGTTGPHTTFRLAMAAGVPWAPGNSVPETYVIRDQKMANENAKINTHLDAFVQNNAQPGVNFDMKDFALNMGTRFRFNPKIKMAPFSTSGEPWPMPQQYHSDKEIVYHVNQTSFRLEVLNTTCAILQRAVDRYTNVIKQYTLEVPYNMVYNFNERVRLQHERAVDAQYEHGQELRSVTVEVADTEDGFPHLHMDESYSLEVDEGRGKIVAGQVWGAIRAMETLSQLFFTRRSDTKLYIRRTIIKDYPRFAHRGILVDTSRHFIHIDTLKDVLEAMSYNKMNVLHWHIVDDNSFPYESKVYPKLSEMGAYHPSLVYTLDDIKDLVQFARERGIRVIPEFDTPGHMFSWLGYPAIKATCFHGNTAHEGPVGPIDPSKNESYEFLGNLFREIFSVFTDRFVHLGGDELMDTCWATNPSIVEYLQRNASIPALEIANARKYVDKALGHYFKRLIRTLSDVAENRSVGATSFILWEDVYKNNKEIPKDSILQVWMGTQDRVRMLNEAGYRTIYSSCWYLDHVKYGVEWTKYYTCEPSPYKTAEEDRTRLLGGEACLWSEFITSETLMTQMWPRASAVAERLWSNRGVMDVDDAGRRLQEHRCRMLRRGLPVGQISGPDYCLRQSKTPTPADSTQHMVQRDRAYFDVAILTHYSYFLPILNIVLSLVGVSMIVMAAGLWRKRPYLIRVSF